METLTNNYQLQALQTRAGTETPYEDAQHAGFGLLTEVGEILDTYKRHRFYKVPLDKKNLIEEVGDVLWYLSVGYHSLKKEMPDTPPVLMETKVEVDLDFLLAKIARSASNFFVIVMVNPDSWEDNYLNIDLDNAYGYLSIFCEQELGVDIKEAAKANLEKLSKRYPGMSFSVEKALNRDVKNELSHIVESNNTGD